MRSWMRVVCLASLVSSAWAQVPVGKLELGVFGGETYGADGYGAMAGGNVSYAVNKYLLPYVEFSYFPELERQFTGTIGGTSNPFTIRYSIAATDFHGGIHVRVPIKESRFFPYGVFGVGRLGYSGGPVTITYVQNGVTNNGGTLTSPGGGRAAINFGGGVRYYAHPRFGFRVEVKGYKPFGTEGPLGGFTGSFLKVEGGFFIQLL